MMNNKERFKDAIEVASGVYWVGMCLENDPFQCHPYFIQNGDESVLVDPGSMLEFGETIKKVKSLTELKNIKYIILHHQDPDLCAAVPEIEKLINRDDLKIITHSRMSLLIKHYLVKSLYYEIDKNNHILQTKNGLRLEFLATPYCHSPGAFVTYEPKTKTLFSGDIFGGIEKSWQFYADENYFEKAKQFHQEYMPSKDIFNYALKKIEALDIELIAPQHGSIIKKEFIKPLIQKMKDLDCGLYIEEKYNAELIDIIKELQEKDKLLFEQSRRAEMGEMIANIAHQWRQPLAIVNTLLAILKEKNELEILDRDEIEEKLKKMEERVVYMSETIEDFMNYYRPNKNVRNFSVYNAFLKAISVSHFNLNDGIVNIDVDKDLEIYGIMNEYVQVIVSILANIHDIKKERNMQNLKVDIRIYKESNDVILEISDNAGGIDEEILPKIFDPYFTTKHQSMGTGLGLHIARMIIEDNFGGTLRATNTEDGAKFTIRIRDAKRYD